MRGLSKSAAKLLVFAGLAVVLAGQPALAAPKAPSGDSPVRSVLRTIIRTIRELTDISFPPG
jgi:hypothetical protein